MGFFHLEWRSHESGKRIFPLSHEWLSRRGEKNFPMSGEAASGEILFLPQLLSHE